MRLRDFAIIVIILGIASAVFTTMMTDPNLEDNYNTMTLHGEENNSHISDALEEAANNTRRKSADLQNTLQQEDDVSLLGLGSNTFEVLKSAMSFEYLDVVSSVFFEIERKYHVPAIIGASLFAILVLLIVFTIVGAFLRWRT